MHALSDDPMRPDVQLVLADIMEPKTPQNVKTLAIKADLTDDAPHLSIFKHVAVQPFDKLDQMSILPHKVHDFCLALRSHSLKSKICNPRLPLPS